jgi:hypothetical protein
MTEQPKKGDRVRLLTRDLEPLYRPGDKGTVVGGPQRLSGGGWFYVVTLDKDGPRATGALFLASEITVDAAMDEHREAS